MEDFKDKHSAGDNEIEEEEDDVGCDLNMESHRNYNTPEEQKKRDGSLMIIPNSIVNVGNPSEKRTMNSNINGSLEEFREGGGPEPSDIEGIPTAYDSYRTLYLKPDMPKARRIRRRM